MPDDAAYLLDILVAARMALQFTATLSWEAFRASDLHQQAVMRQIEIIGEASNKISPAVRAAHSEIPWRAIIGMRHRLIHEYFRVDITTVWDVIQNDIPALVTLIEPLIPPEEEA